jgi:hypothetical protein
MTCHHDLARWVKSDYARGNPRCLRRRGGLESLRCNIGSRGLPGGRLGTRGCDALRIPRLRSLGLPNSAGFLTALPVCVSGVVDGDCAAANRVVDRSYASVIGTDIPLSGKGARDRWFSDRATAERCGRCDERRREKCSEKYVCHGCPLSRPAASTPFPAPAQKVTGCGSQHPPSCRTQSSDLCLGKHRRASAC